MTANRIIAHVFSQPSLQQVPEEVIAQLAADHPYFAAAHLLLARKVYQRTGDPRDAAVKKALLYTSQPHHAWQLITENQVLQEVQDRVAAVIPDDVLPPETPVTEALPVVEDLIAEAVPENAIREAAAPEETAAVADFEPAAAHSSPGTDTLPPPVITAGENGTAKAGEKLAVADETPESAEPIRIFPMTAAEETTELVFQPLYTDDYFAYKRLKNPEEADTLNEQGAAEMKSFTSWLRQMKDNFAGKSNKDWYHQQLHRMYEEEEEPEVSETVEKMAMDSIVFNNDIVSETLAEIWVRQHQYDNAIKIYQKLSLLNPDKNAYFAQKIFELKSLTDKK